MSQIVDNQIDYKFISDSNLNHPDVQITNENINEDQDIADSQEDPDISFELSLNNSDIEIENYNIKPELEMFRSEHHGQLNESESDSFKNSNCLKEINHEADLMQNQHQLARTDESSRRSANNIIQLLGGSSLNAQASMDIQEGGKPYKFLQNNQI